MTTPDPNSGQQLAPGAAPATPATSRPKPPPPDSGKRPTGDRMTHTLPDHLLGDGPCTDCGTVDNIVWFTDSVFWNAVVRQGDYVEPILCIPCFVKRTDAAGYAPAGWRLMPEFHWETHDERAARIERWPDPGPPLVRCRLCPGLPYYAVEDFDGHVRAKHPAHVRKP